MNKMNGICDICKQPYAGIMVDVINDKGEKEQIQICFNCVGKRADEIMRGTNTALSIVGDFENKDGE
jgi:protein-arginine kinase activator protein McsA